MELQHIELNQLKTTKLNVRKIGAKDTADLEASIRSLGIIQPLLVRANCEGFEVIAGQRRFHALTKLAEEAGINDTGIEPVPCLVMTEGDDAKAIEASLAENFARLSMDEIDQYKAFSALAKQGNSIEDIAAQFGITDRQVKQRLALGNLHTPILTAYRKEEIGADTLRSLTLATTKQQKLWWELFKSEDQHAPQGRALKSWLFGGADIPLENALFDVTDYEGTTIADLFGETSYFDDATTFWTHQNQAIASAKDAYLQNGWQEVSILDIGEFWSQWEHVKTARQDGGRVYVQVASNGEVKFHEGYLTEAEAKRQKQIEAGEDVTAPPKAEITKAMQNYLALHRHSAVRAELLGHNSIALRLAVAQIIAGSNLWQVQADPQKANTDAIAESLTTNKAEGIFDAERQQIRALLGMDDVAEDTLVYRKDDWGKAHDIHAVFARLIELDDVSVSKILTFVVAETLPCGSAMVEVLGSLLNVDMADYWQPDQTSTQSVFLDLLRDKEAINAIVKQVAGKNAADGNVTATAKVQKKIIQDCLNGTRTDGKTDWQPRYMDFPMGAYTKRGGIEAIDQYKAVKRHFK